MGCFSLCTRKSKGVVVGALATYGIRIWIEFECGALTSPTIYTIVATSYIPRPSIYFAATGVVTRQFDCNGCDLGVAVELECDGGTSPTSNIIGEISYTPSLFYLAATGDAISTCNGQDSIRMFLNKHYLKEYPNITNYLQNLYQIPGIAESSNLTHCIFGYFGRTWRRVIPKIQLKYASDFNGKHNRIEKFGKCRITAIGKMDKKEDNVNINEAKEDLDADKDCVTISAHNGANVVKISVHGATVISWKVNDVERLFLSSKAKLDGSKAVRGGIPLVFPQFGPGAMKQHGFARVLKWKVLEMDDKRAYSNRAILYLENQDGVTDSEPWNWKHKFRLEYRVTIVNASDISGAKVLALMVITIVPIYMIINHCCRIETERELCSLHANSHYNRNIGWWFFCLGAGDRYTKHLVTGSYR